MVALAMGLRGLGKEVRMYSPDGVSPMYSFLALAAEVQAQVGGEDVQWADAVLLLDCDGASRTGALEQWLRHSKVLLDVDHHEKERAFGDVRWVDPKRAAVAEMVYELLGEMGITVTPEMATALLAGIYVDTGSLRYSNTRPQTYRLCAELARLGARAEEVSAHLYEVRSYAALRILGEALRSAQLDWCGSIIWSALPREVFEVCGASPDDMEGVIDLLRGHRDSQVALLAYERPDGMVKVSLRSKNSVDVAEVAREWGGGGHTRAAGFERRVPLQQVVEETLARLRACLGGPA